MRYNRTVVGYHGCDEVFASALLAGHAQFKASGNDYDWLGPGIYFWEYGADRARRWADEQAAHRPNYAPAVIGALIHLGDCFDLLDTRFTHDISEAFEIFRAAMADEGRDLPKNRGQPPELKLRDLDCALLKWYLDLLEGDGQKYDTVRGGFVEGGPAFDGSGICRETHIQIAVRNPAAIIGVFRPLD